MSPEVPPLPPPRETPPLPGEPASRGSRLSRVRGRLTLPTVRRATGLLDGRHKSVFVGHGQDFDDLSQYRPGDDVTDIDWKASARCGQLVIKRYQRESNLPLVLAVDTGRTMAAQTPTGEDKRTLALAVAEIFSYLARMRGDTVALVAGDSKRMITRPPRAGAEHAEMLLSVLARAWAELEEPATDANRLPDLRPDAPLSDVRQILGRVITWHPHRSLVVLLTDTSHPDETAVDQLRRLSAQHELVVVQVADDVAVRPGAGRARDVEMTAELPAFLREDAALARTLEQEVAGRRQAVAQLLDRRHIEHVSVESEETLIDSLADLLERQRRLAAVGRGRR
ncbi:Uncharacterized conserved protein (some members contain a von Willebrand factor type A (vWA) domain) [Actinomyces bovis]|uniref:Uncharacterized conserved protein (Some members contain a von Willebrand factor type A (VWA) domain) n=1 Tax=Actinomyces bovis TaxID=1658 RepID=A0ABY1VPN0_9ACTO|nr:DUF58 domain-containing protein [Actinomyces bovis]SPT53586.1 Uncharacterized conserved protein (some members contain a von Willebrand factor type A (vWA) domain) [Actinomyces bovis]VEG55592.1 Uncharacterized conserved protein (some members contain a von Willebrand factor type A (vWA) domain) [Actinomyces israelii]